MAVPFFLSSLYFLLSHFAFLHTISAQENNKIQISCPKSFDCIHFGPLQFPLTNSSEFSQCGLCTVTCGRLFPTIQLENGGPSYDVKRIESLADSLRAQIHHPRLQTLLYHNNCDSFNNLSFPNSPSISFTILRNLTFFKCNRSRFRMNFNSSNFYIYTGCNDYDLYYNKNLDDRQYSAPANLDCSVIQLPLKSHAVNLSAAENPFGILDSTFFIELHVSENCRKCNLGGGQCQNDDDGFHCTTKQGGTNFRLILSTVIPGAAIMICALIVVIIRRRSWDVHSLFLSRNLSSVPSRNADNECSKIFFGVPVFSYRELEEATNNFDPSKEVGDGAFGAVYHGKLQDGREVAVKRLYEHNYKRLSQFLNEVEILARLRHRNLVSLYGCTSRHSRELLLVYDYIPNGTVADHLHDHRSKNPYLPWPVRLNIAVETAAALSYLHASDIIHRDVKTTNLLLDHNFSVKVADFGLSRLFPADVTHVSTVPQGTPGYVDPEYHRCYQLTDKSDVYSFGVVLIELISSLPAVDINRHSHEINLAELAVKRIQNGDLGDLIDPLLGWESDSLIWKMAQSVAEIAFRCLQMEKTMRPRMDEVLETLKEIQEYSDDDDDYNDDHVEIRRLQLLPPSSDGDDEVLLKNSKEPPPSDFVNNI